MQEAEWYGYWQYYENTAQTLCWENNRLRILQSGVLNEHEGPDFRHACFELNGVIYRGAVEFHINLDDWYRHNHQHDPAYHDVVLHVLAKPPVTGKAVTHSLSGREIPTFVLPRPQVDNKRIDCFPPKKFTNRQLKHLLQQLALQRMSLKARAFGQALKDHNEHTVFYQGYMRVLGYPFNKNAFEMVARGIPGHLYESYRNRPLLLTALYFGCSGFLQAGAHDLFTVRLKKLFAGKEACLSGAPLSKGQWQLSAVRPRNHPHFRMAAWIAFLASLQNQAPFNMLYRLLQQRLDYHEMYLGLHKVLAVKTTGYWQEHYALQKPLKHKRNQVYLGKDRINELISNLIIPLSVAKANKNNNLGFSAYLRELYLQMPGSYHYGALHRKRPWIDEYKNIWQSCNTGQAFLHLNDLYCTRMQCGRCPLHRKTAS